MITFFVLQKLRLTIMSQLRLFDFNRRAEWTCFAYFC